MADQELSMDRKMAAMQGAGDRYQRMLDQADDPRQAPSTLREMRQDLERGAGREISRPPIRPMPRSNRR